MLNATHARRLAGFATIAAAALAAAILAGPAGAPQAARAAEAKCGDVIKLAPTRAVKRARNTYHVVSSIADLKSGKPACKTYEVVLYFARETPPQKAPADKRQVVERQSVAATDIARRLRADLQWGRPGIFYVQWLIRTKPGSREFWAAPAKISIAIRN